MKYIFRYSILLILISIFVGGCSDVRKDISTTAPVVSAHKVGNLNVNSPDFHGNVVRLNNWSMKECQQCHSADYSGGNTGASCFKCHTSAEGPEACNTCHGDFKDASKIAPPRDTKGNTANTADGVGAHQNHLYTNTLGKKVECSDCHVVPASLGATGHIDSPLPAEVNFSGLADTNIATNATFDPATLTCSNVYCHGNFEFKKADADPTNQFAYTSDKMVGNNFSPVWNKVDGTQAKCGTCHGLPPTGHIQTPITACYLCHQGVVDEMGNIIDKDKHINGYKSARGSLNKLQEFLGKIK
ncbi:MAG TPA: CxxxxCH/CxxCH domain-containing protein [Bacteroidales bacterium]|nr:CxxxxCH/CxxCH domain-containing protein [Bacteroidales bacterium]